jgi:hypothetical protein
VNTTPHPPAAQSTREQGRRPPTAEDLASRSVLKQAITRFEAVANTGGAILGNRPLDDDGLVAIDPDDFSVGAEVSVWGWAYIVEYAESTFA